MEHSDHIDEQEIQRAPQGVETLAVPKWPRLKGIAKEMRNKIGLVLAIAMLAGGGVASAETFKLGGKQKRYGADMRRRTDKAVDVILNPDTNSQTDSNPDDPEDTVREQG